MGQVAVDVVDVEQEEHRSEHTSLDDACFDSHPLCCRLAYLNLLPAITKVRGNPFDQPHWQVLFKLDEQLIVWHEVKCFREVEEYRYRTGWP